MGCTQLVCPQHVFSMRLIFMFVIHYTAFGCHGLNYMAGTLPIIILSRVRLLYTLVIDFLHCYGHEGWCISECTPQYLLVDLHRLYG